MRQIILNTLEPGNKGRPKNSSPRENKVTPMNTQKTDSCSSCDINITRNTPQTPHINSAVVGSP